MKRLEKMLCLVDLFRPVVVLALGMNRNGNLSGLAKHSHLSMECTKKVEKRGRRTRGMNKKEALPFTLIHDHRAQTVKSVLFWLFDTGFIPVLEN